MIDLDHLEHLLASATPGTFAYSVDHDGAAERLSAYVVETAPDLLHLSRRGLRAEREVCGTCRWWDGSLCLSCDGLGIGRACADTDYCCAWSAKEGA